MKDLGTNILSTHIGVTCGLLKIAALGGVNNEWIYVMHGPCLADLRSCLNDASSQEVVCSNECGDRARIFHPEVQLFKLTESNNYLIESIGMSTSPSFKSTKSNLRFTFNILGSSNEHGDTANTNTNNNLNIPTQSTTSTPMNMDSTIVSSSSKSLKGDKKSTDNIETGTDTETTETSTPVLLLINRLQNISENERKKSYQFICKPIRNALSYYSSSNLLSPSPSSSSESETKIMKTFMTGMSEMRKVTTIFINLNSFDVTSDIDPIELQPFCLLLQNLLLTTGGFLRQFLIDDKGAVAIVMFGIQGFTYGNDEERALEFAWLLNLQIENINHKCSIGISTGNTYCGVVGSSIRSEFTGIAHEVNVAARLMAKANNNVLIDPKVLASLSAMNKEALIYYKELHLKGLNAPMVPFTFKEDTVFLTSTSNDRKAERKTAVLRSEVMKSLLSIIIDRKRKGGHRKIDLLLLHDSPLHNFQKNVLSDEKSAVYINGSNSYYNIEVNRMESDLSCSSDGSNSNGRLSHDDFDISPRFTPKTHRSKSSHKISNTNKKTHSIILKPPVFRLSVNSTLLINPLHKFIILMGKAGTGKAAGAHFFKQRAIKAKIYVSEINCRHTDQTVPYAILKKLFWSLYEVINNPNEKEHHINNSNFPNGSPRMSYTTPRSPKQLLVPLSSSPLNSINNNNNNNMNYNNSNNIDNDDPYSIPSDKKLIIIVNLFMSLWCDVSDMADITLLENHMDDIFKMVCKILDVFIPSEFSMSAYILSMKPLETPHSSRSQSSSSNGPTMGMNTERSKSSSSMKKTFNNVRKMSLQGVVASTIKPLFLQRRLSAPISKFPAINNSSSSHQSDMSKTTSSSVIGGSNSAATNTTTTTTSNNMIANDIYNDNNSETNRNNISPSSSVLGSSINNNHNSIDTSNSNNDNGNNNSNTNSYSNLDSNNTNNSNTHNNSHLPQFTLDLFTLSRVLIYMLNKIVNGMNTSVVIEEAHFCDEMTWFVFSQFNYCEINIAILMTINGQYHGLKDTNNVNLNDSLTNTITFNTTANNNTTNTATITTTNDPLILTPSSLPMSTSSNILHNIDTIHPSLSSSSLQISSSRLLLPPEPPIAVAYSSSVCNSPVPNSIPMTSNIDDLYEDSCDDLSAAPTFTLPPLSKENSLVSARSASSMSSMSIPSLHHNKRKQLQQQQQSAINNNSNNANNNSNSSFNSINANTNGSRSSTPKSTPRRNNENNNNNSSNIKAGIATGLITTEHTRLSIVSEHSHNSANASHASESPQKTKPDNETHNEKSRLSLLQTTRGHRTSCTSTEQPLTSPFEHMNNNFNFNSDLNTNTNTNINTNNVHNKLIPLTEGPQPMPNNLIQHQPSYSQIPLLTPTSSSIPPFLRKLSNLTQMEYTSALSLMTASSVASSNKSPRLPISPHMSDKNDADDNNSNPNLNSTMNSTSVPGISDTNSTTPSQTDNTPKLSQKSNLSYTSATNNTPTHNTSINNTDIDDNTLLKVGYIYENSPAFHTIIQDTKNTTLIEFSELSILEVKEVLKTILSSKEEIPQFVINQVYQTCAGSTFWVKEMAKFIKKIGLKEYASKLKKSYKRDSKDNSNMNNEFDPLKNVIISILDKLTPDALNVIKHASVIGPDFVLNKLKNILSSNYDYHKFLDAIAEARDLGLIQCVEETPIVIYAFQNQIIHNTIYNMIPPRDASVIHLNIATNIQNTYIGNLAPYYQR